MRSARRLGMYAILAAFVLSSGCEPVTGPDADHFSYEYEGALAGRFVAEYAYAAVDSYAESDRTDIWGLVGSGSEPGQLLIVLPGIPQARNYPFPTGAWGGYATYTPEYAAFEFVSGSIELSSVRGRRLRGTFSGTMREVNGTRTIVVRNGRFEVPLKSRL